jgi:putative ABC transport system permease protein
MLNNFFKTIWRQLRRQPGFYLLNISGLAVGIASFIIMYQYASYELRFDAFHENADDIYRLNLEYTAEGKPTYFGAAVFGGVGPTLKTELPQVVDFVRIVPGYDGGGILRYGDKSLRTKEIQYTESSFFNVFSYRLLEGNVTNCLDNLNTVVISKTIENNMFGQESGIGKFLKVQSVNGVQDFLITGIFESREDAHFRGEVLLSLSTLEIPWEAEFDINWGFFDFNTYIQLLPNINPDDVHQQFPSIIAKNRPSTNNVKVEFGLIPVQDIHLDSHINQELQENGDRQAVTLLLVISFLILFIALINYINLYTAYATERGKEVGIRKTLGSGKHLLRLQFLLEAGITNLMSIGLALLIIITVSQPLGNYNGLEVNTNFFGATGFWLGLISFWLLGSILAGIYPAIVMSNFKPLTALRSVNGKSTGGLRKVIVVWQFSASACLLVGVMVVHRQLTEMNNRPTGINTEQLVLVDVPNFTSEVDDYYNALNGLKNSLLNQGGIVDVSYASNAPGQEVGWRGSSRLIGANSDDNGGMIFKLVVDKDYVSTYNLNVLAGRNYVRLEERESVILNEEALAIYGFQNAQEAINKEIFFSNLDTLKVIGVVENYHQESLREPIKPTAYIQNYMGLQYLFVRANTANQVDVIDKIESAFNDHFPDLPFDWKLMEDQMAERHQSESQFMKAFNLFVLLAFGISMLGLLGLVSFNTRKRQKEMAVRKVLGSSVPNIIGLFFNSFIKLAFIGNLIALPIIYFIADRWLNQFAFRIEFIWWAPLVALVLCIVISFITTIKSILKVARVNPVNVLNHD